MKFSSEKSKFKKGNKISTILKNRYVFSFFSSGVLFVLSVFNGILINRYLGPNLKGEYAYYLNIVNLIVLIFNFGVYQSYPYFKRKKIADAKEKFFNILMLQFFFNLIVSIISSLLVKDITILLFLLLIPIIVLSKQLSFLSLVEEVRQKNILTMISSSTYTIGLVFIFFTVKQNIIFVIFMLYLQEILMIVFFLNKYNYRISVSKFNLSFVLEVLKHGFVPMLTVLMSTLNYQIDVFIVKQLLDFTNVGLYTVGVGFANMIGIIPNVFQEVLFSKATEDGLKKEVVSSLKITFYINLVLAVIFLWVADEVIILLYGTQFSEASTVAKIIIFGMIPITFFKIISTLYLVEGKQRLNFIVLFIAVIMNIVLNYSIIPVLGINGAAIASTVSYSISGMLIIYFFLKDNDLKFRSIFTINKKEINHLLKIFNTFTVNR